MKRTISHDFHSPSRRFSYGRWLGILVLAFLLLGIIFLGFWEHDVASQPIQKEIPHEVITP